MENIADFLPMNLKAIYDEFGLDVMLKVWHRFGGTVIYVPKKPTENHALLTLLGDEIAVAFCKHFKTEYLRIEKANAVKIEIRNRMIKELYQKGVTQNSIALMLDLDSSTVRRILRDCPHSHQQQEDLFF